MSTSSHSISLTKSADGARLGPVLGYLLVALVAGCGSSVSRPSRQRPIGAGLSGPAGLKATVYARGLPTVATFALDPHGRLWAAAAGLTNHDRDGVYLIARAGARPVRIISGLDDPLGLLWYGGRLYVASVGQVTAYGSFTGTRFTTRTTIVDGPVRGGENNNLVMSPDHRLVMGITATCDHCLPRARFSGSIVSFRPDGRDLRLYAARVRAPVGLTYYPGSSDLFVSMNQRDDLGPRTTGDALAVVRANTNWRFPTCYGQVGPACVGVPTPVAVLDEHAAVGSIAFVSEGRENGSGAAALVTEWQTGKVLRVSLRKATDGFSGSVGPWLTGLRNPLALIRTGRNSWLVGDWGTGTSYRIISRSP